MHRNVGVTEKAMRIAAGVVLLGLASVDIAGPWGYLGVLPLVTGLARWCPLYAAFGTRVPAHARNL